MLQSYSDGNRETSRELRTQRGLVIYARKWRLDVHNHQSGHLRVFVRIDEILKVLDPIDIIGNDDNPRDINSRDSIKALLANPERRHIYLKEERGPPLPLPSPRQPAPLPSEDEPASQVSSQRRPLSAEEAARWAKVDRVPYNEYQIDAQTQGMLDSDKAWYQPGDVEEYKQTAGQQEEDVPSGNVPSVLRTDGQPPDLASPESSPDRARDSLVYQTQAIPMESQSNGDTQSNGDINGNGQAVQDHVPVVGPTQVETSEEQAFEWEATPPPESRSPEEPVQHDQPPEREFPEAVATPEEEPYKSQVLPASILGPLHKEAPPPLNSDDEGSENESAVSDALEETEHEEPASQEVIFNEDAKRDGVGGEMVVEEPSQSMVVSTAQILSQHIDSAGELTDIIEVSETIEDRSQIVQETSVEIMHDTEEEMPDVEPSANMTHVSISVEKEGSSKDFVVPGTLLADQSTSTINDDSTPTQYPNSTPSNPTQQPTQSQSQTQSEEPSRPPTAQPILPPPPVPTRSTSPPKATPTSVQIQVQETPLPLQHQQLPSTELVSSAVRATAPSAGKRSRSEEAPRRKHKRDRHVGPIVPRFSRKERKGNWDLEVILLEDRRRWMAEHRVEPVLALQEEVVAEEVMKPADEPVVEREEEREEEQLQAQVEEEKPERLGEAMEDVQTTQRQEMVMENDPPAEQQEAITAEEEDVIEIPEIEPEPIEQPAEPAPPPPPQPSLATKWGRFAAHWRRFTPLLQHNENT